jgi:hypothetical protein
LVLSSRKKRFRVEVTGIRSFRALTKSSRRFFGQNVGDEAMLKRTPLRSSLAVMLALFCVALLLPVLAAQSDKPAVPDKHATSRLRIEVTGGDANKPVPDASVYIRFPEKKKVELDLKTNLEGIARSPEIPQGKILIQIVVSGWKTYGEYHDITDPEQTIQIHLVRPTTRWY